MVLEMFRHSSQTREILSKLTELEFNLISMEFTHFVLELQSAETLSCFEFDAGETTYDIIFAKLRSAEVILAFDQFDDPIVVSVIPTFQNLGDSGQAHGLSS